MSFSITNIVNRNGEKWICIAVL